MPKVSVIIPTYNRAHFIAGAIESVLAQTYKDYELIVIDDGSTDATAEVMKAYHGKLRYVPHENRGITSNMNMGVAEAKGEYFAMLGDDDLWLPDLLETQVTVLEKDPKLAFVCSGTHFINEQGKITKTASRGALRNKTFESLLEENFVSHLTAVVRRKCFNDVGGFDEQLATTQDYDLWLRLSKRYPFAYTDLPLAKYRVHGQNLSLKFEQHLADHLAILNKKEIVSGLTRREIREYRARVYHMFGGFYSEAGDFSRAAVCYKKAWMTYPLIGMHYWPKEVEQYRFTLAYRLLRPYWVSLWYGIKPPSAQQPNKKPSSH